VGGTSGSDRVAYFGGTSLALESGSLIHPRESHLVSLLATRTQMLRRTLGIGETDGGPALSRTADRVRDRLQLRRHLSWESDRLPDLGAISDKGRFISSFPGSNPGSPASHPGLSLGISGAQGSGDISGG
jgi:hypothetical protein